MPGYGAEVNKCSTLGPSWHICSWEGAESSDFVYVAPDSDRQLAHMLERLPHYDAIRMVTGVINVLWGVRVRVRWRTGELLYWVVFVRVAGGSGSQVEPTSTRTTPSFISERPDRPSLSHGCWFSSWPHTPQEGPALSQTLLSTHSSGKPLSATPTNAHTYTKKGREITRIHRATIHPITRVLTCILLRLSSLPNFDLSQKSTPRCCTHSFAQAPRRLLT